MISRPVLSTLRTATVRVRALSSFVEPLDPILSAPLAECDPDMAKHIVDEGERQKGCLNLIASENFMSAGVHEALGSNLCNKYSEGYPGARYYGGNEIIDKVESLCQQRALEAYDLDPEKWGVNVQTLSGSPANLQVYTALMKPHDRIMGLDLPHGGHLTHGFQTPQKRISATSIFFESMPYRVNIDTGLIDYDALEMTANLYRPQILVAGMSAYSRHLDYARFKDISDQCGAILMADMAHISGLVAARVVPGPFEDCDIVTTTTHKTLRGPRGAMIFYRKGVKGVNKAGKEVMYDYERKINSTIFPGMQGGPHNHTIGALAVALKMSQTDEFRRYQLRVLANSQAMCNKFIEMGYPIICGGTDNHLFLVNTTAKGADGVRAEAVLDAAGITVNKNTIPGDKSAVTPSGLRLGTPAMTSRGLNEEGFIEVARLVDEGVKIAADMKLALREAGTPKIVDFKKAIASGMEAERIAALKDRASELSLALPVVGWKE